MKVFLGTALILLLILQYKLWFGDSGYGQIRKYEMRIEDLNRELEKARNRNAALQSEVDDLKNGMAAVEERARRDLGMIRKNETFFQIIEPSTNASEPSE